jgi:hypothetical protein
MRRSPLSQDTSFLMRFDAAVNKTQPRQLGREDCWLGVPPELISTTAGITPIAVRTRRN